MPPRPFLAATAVALALAGCAASSASAPSGASRASDSVSAQSAGQAAAPRASTAVCGRVAKTHYKHVIWILMENRSYSSVLGPDYTAPNLSRYAKKCGVATNDWAVTHPSLPNYIALTSGSNYGITSDCEPSTCPVRHKSLFTQVTNAGKQWRSYAESMTTRCDHASYGNYAARHNPAVYYPSLASQCATKDVPMGGTNGRFAHALANSTLPAFAFVTPNLCSDGHNCSTATADTWLGGWLDRITSSPAYRANDTVVFVTWDEGVGSDNRIATVVIGPTVTRGTRAGARYSHYSLLRTTEQILGLPFLANAATARSMRAAFGL